MPTWSSPEKISRVVELCWVLWKCPVRDTKQITITVYRNSCRHCYHSPRIRFGLGFKEMLWLDIEFCSKYQYFPIFDQKSTKMQKYETCNWSLLVIRCMHCTKMGSTQSTVTYRRFLSLSMLMNITWHEMITVIKWILVCSEMSRTWQKISSFLQILTLTLDSSTLSLCKS